MDAKKRFNEYPRAFQLMALERMKNCEIVSALAEALGIHRTCVITGRTAGRLSRVGPPIPRCASCASKCTT